MVLSLSCLNRYFNAHSLTMQIIVMYRKHLGTLLVPMNYLSRQGLLLVRQPTVIINLVTDATKKKLLKT
jgi:hypothetical protein